MKTLALALQIVILSLTARGQGPYAPAAGIPGTTAMHKDSSAFVDWAIGVTFLSGWINVADTSFGKTSTTNPYMVAGIADGGVVSLGDRGQIILSFHAPIYDGPGADFAVFENGFNDTFLEFAHVEVSTDGIAWGRIPSTCLIPTDSQMKAFDTTSTTFVHNLAGKYRAQFGTPFDLADLTGLTEVNPMEINFVRLIDVVGSIDSAWGSTDAQGNFINDPWPTPFPTSGFDLDAVGVIHSLWATRINGQTNAVNCQTFPNPFQDHLQLIFSERPQEIRVIDLFGHVVVNQVNLDGCILLSTSEWQKGIYLIEIQFSNELVRKKVIRN